MPAISTVIKCLVTLPQQKMLEVIKNNITTGYSIINDVMYKYIFTSSSGEISGYLVEADSCDFRKIHENSNGAKNDNGLFNYVRYCFGKSFPIVDIIKVGVEKLKDELFSFVLRPHTGSMEVNADGQVKIGEDTYNYGNNELYNSNNKTSWFGFTRDDCVESEVRDFIEAQLSAIATTSTMDGEFDPYAMQHGNNDNKLVIAGVEIPQQLVWAAMGGLVTLTLVGGGMVIKKCVGERKVRSGNSDTDDSRNEYDSGVSLVGMNGSGTTDRTKQGYGKVKNCDVYNINQRDGNDGEGCSNATSCFDSEEGREEPIYAVPYGSSKNCGPSITQDNVSNTKSSGYAAVGKIPNEKDGPYAVSNVITEDTHKYNFFGDGSYSVVIGKDGHYSDGDDH